VHSARAALACVFAIAACGDGIGVPIQRAVVTADGGDDASTPDVVGARCAEVEVHWSEEDEIAEGALVAAINARRTRGLYCGDTEFSAKPALDVARELQCSARLHTLDIVMRGYVSEMGSDGSYPGDRMEAAGFDHGRTEESIIANETDPYHVFQRLLGRREDCRNIGIGDFTHIGIGYHQGLGLWTIDYAEADSGDDHR
jgi:uncharacterized protein YkwD